MKCLLICIFGLVTMTSALPVASLQQDFGEYSAGLIDRINAMNSTWKAGPNFVGETVGAVLSRFGKVEGVFSPEEKKPIFPVTDDVTDIPKEFDARTKWPQCSSTGRISDQGCCNAFWAFAAVEVINDRYCISQGMHLNISAEDALSCNPYIVPNRGCNAAGSPSMVLKAWGENGLVTGGVYGSDSGCRPYPYKPCNHYENGTYGPCQKPPEMTTCVKSCRAGYSKEYQQDKHYGSYYSVAQSETSIQREIMTNGSVAAYIISYQDFPHYRTGVYRHTSDTKIGAFSLKILGWGVEGGQNYWLCASSWNTEWGDKGFIKVLRGVNESGIEGNVKAGTPMKL